MNSYIDSIQLIFKKYHKQFYYIIPLLTIGILSLGSNFLYIDKKVINKGILWDMAGRPYETFLYELNLPRSVGAIFVAGTLDNLEKTEKYYKKYNIGDIFTSQLRSLLGEKITEISIAGYINFVFGISAILFSILAGYLIFKNGYISIILFLLIVIFRNYSQGLIYGLPLRHNYAVFNPLLAFCIAISIIIFLKNQSKKLWIILILSGFAMAYIAHCRTSEGQIVIASMVLFVALMCLEYLKVDRKYFKKQLLSVFIIFATMYIGYAGYYKMIAAFEYHRDKKFNFSPGKEEMFFKQYPYHSLYISLFRYEIPNRFGDKIGYEAVYERYPEIRKKFSGDINYVELSYSHEYHNAIREVYFDYVFNNPKYVLTYLVRSVHDYLLFLPYYSWTGNKSAHAYLPKINEGIEIKPQDLAPDFKATSLNWILNLKVKYLPQSLLFWLYFVFAYLILMEAIYTSFVRFRKISIEAGLGREVVENNLPIYLLRGMLIYFFFASIIRTLIPVHGQSAVVAFNIIIIYNLVRIVVSIGIIKTKKVEIPAIKMPAWLVLLIGISLLSLTVKSFESFQEPTFNSGFERNTRGWIAYKANLYSVDDGQSGNCLKIITSDNAIGYGYSAFPTEVGEMYKVTAYFKSGTATNGQIKVGTSIDDTNLYYSGVLSNANWKQYSGIFRATTTTTYITLVSLTSIKGQTSLFDTITIKQIEDYSK